MAQKKFRVERSFTSYGYVIVTAKNREEAREKAEEIDGGDFISEDDYLTGDSEITSVELETPEETPAEKIYNNHFLFFKIEDAQKAQDEVRRDSTKRERGQAFWEAEPPTISACDGSLIGDRKELRSKRLTKKAVMDLIEEMLIRFDGTLPDGFEIWLEQPIIYYATMQDKMDRNGEPSGDVAATKILAITKPKNFML